MVVQKQASQLLFAMSTAERGQGMVAVASELGYESTVLSEVEELLYHTRGAVPAALVLEDKLLARVPQLDLIALLRRRKSLASVPLICLGAASAERQAAVVASGADLYLTLPTSPAVLKAYLQRLLDRREADAALRGALAKLRDFEQAYKDAERVKDDLTHMLVHDLKGPISSVMGLLDHSVDVLRASPDEGGLLELLSLARSESQHLLNLAANILDVRRMKEGFMPYQPERVSSLTDLIQVALNDAGAGKERQFSSLIRPEAEQPYADAALLRRVLANLLANAVKHTRRGGHIDFRAYRQDDAYILSVRDDGEGIPEADQKRIFNAFEQSRHTVHDRFDTGMGLTFCKLAVEKHGGRIWVESKVGRGSTFTFTLPAKPQEELDLLEANAVLTRA
jgi:signal transduction histidine kinase